MPADTTYLDGNSLGALPVATAERLQRVVLDEWGTNLVESWNTAAWMQMPRLIGDKIAGLIGAGANEVAVADSTSVNLFKVLSAAVRLQASKQIRGVILSQRDNFPTDLYIAASVAEANGLRLELVDAEELQARMTDATAESIAVVVLTHVNYRTGYAHDMPRVTAIAHAAGALMVWDLAHSAGALEVDLRGAGADFAVGCGYKYLNGGPGAPAFAWAHEQHVAAMTQPLSGWMGHAAPFDFTTTFQAGAGAAQLLCGTPAILAMVALDAGVDTVAAAGPFGGMGALRAKSVALTDLFISLVQPICDQHGMSVASPLDASCRASQVSLIHRDSAYQIVQALIARRVIGDFRSPDLLRFGFTPLYTRFVDAYDAAQQLDAVLTSGEWRDERFAQRAAVT